MGTAQSRIDESDDERRVPRSGADASASASANPGAPPSDDAPVQVAGQRRRRDARDDQSADQDTRPSLRRRLLHPIRSSARLSRPSSAAVSAAGTDAPADPGAPSGAPAEDATPEPLDVSRRVADVLDMALRGGRFTTQAAPRPYAGTDRASRMPTSSVPMPFHGADQPPDSGANDAAAPSRPRSSSMSRLSRLRLPLLARAPRDRSRGFGIARQGSSPDPLPQAGSGPGLDRPRRPGLGRGPGVGLDLGRMIHELSNLQRRLMAPQNGAPGAAGTGRPTEASLVTSGTYIVVQGVFMARYNPPHSPSPSTSTPATSVPTSGPEETTSHPGSDEPAGQAPREAQGQDSSSFAAEPTPPGSDAPPSSSDAPRMTPADHSNATEQGALLTRMITVAASAVATNLLDPAQIMSRTMRGSIPPGYSRPDTPPSRNRSSSDPQTTGPNTSSESPAHAEGSQFSPAPETSAEPNAPATGAGGEGQDPQRTDLPGMLRSALAGETPGPGPAPHLHAESQPWPRACPAPGAPGEERETVSTPGAGPDPEAVLAGHHSPAGWTHASLESSLQRARLGRVDDGPAHTFDHWLHMLSTDLVAAIERAWEHRRARQSAAQEGGTAANPGPAEGGEERQASEPSATARPSNSAPDEDEEVRQRRADDVIDDEIVFLRMFRFDPQPSPASAHDGSASSQEPRTAPPTAGDDQAGSGEGQQGQAPGQVETDGSQSPSDNLVPHLVAGIRSTHLPAETGASEGESVPVRYSILITGGYYEPSHPLRTMPLRGPGREMMYLMELLSTLQTFAGTFSPSVKKATQQEIDASNTLVLQGREAIVAAFQQGQIQGGEAEQCCSVCYDDWTDDCRARVLPCKHVFHVDCVDRWITQASNSCPLCRREAVPSSTSASGAASGAGAGRPASAPDRPEQAEHQ